VIPADRQADRSTLLERRGSDPRTESPCRSCKAEFIVIGCFVGGLHFLSCAMSNCQTWAAVHSSLTPSSALQHCFGHPNAPPPSHQLSVRRERQLRRLALCLVLPRPIHANYYRQTLSTLHRIPRTRTLLRAKVASFLPCASTRLLPCMLSPLCHNRLIWRRTGMRYGRSASFNAAHHPRLTSPSLHLQFHVPGADIAPVSL